MIPFSSVTLHIFSSSGILCASADQMCNQGYQQRTDHKKKIDSQKSDKHDKQHESLDDFRGYAVQFRENARQNMPAVQPRRGNQVEREKNKVVNAEASFLPVPQAREPGSLCRAECRRQGKARSWQRDRQRIPSTCSSVRGAASDSRERLPRRFRKTPSSAET